MATRFYFPSSGTSPLNSLAVDASWGVSDVTRLPTSTSKSNTALTTTTKTWAATTTKSWVWFQFVTDVINEDYVLDSQDTITMVLGKTKETTTSGDTHLAFVLRVVNGDGSINRGIAGGKLTTSTEFPTTAASRLHNAITLNYSTNPIPICKCDRLVLELGVYGATPAMESIDLRIGDPTNTQDFTLTSGSTSDYVSWWELSKNITFGTPDYTTLKRYTYISTNSVTIYRETGTWYAEVEYLTLGSYEAYPASIAVRFTNVTIPINSIIVDAYVQLAAMTSESNSSVTYNAKGEDVDDSTSITSVSDFNSRTRTTASVTGSAASNIVAGSVYDFASIPAIIQEIVDRSGWVSGNSITIFLEGTNTNSQYHNYNSFAYSTDSDVSPKLIIEYATIKSLTDTLT